ncbi:hypothetical protein B4100_2005 [Heyndrickxia coagulans]|nr:hypothetical protein B4100_2005 [Heyndrickxia coagulans]
MPNLDEKNRCIFRRRLLRHAFHEKQQNQPSFSVFILFFHYT